MKEVYFQAEAEIVGTHPILLHKCVLSKANAQTGPDPDYSDEWRKTTYLDQGGEFVVIHSMMLEAMLRVSSKGHKLGKFFMSKLVPAGVEVNEFETPLLSPESKKITLQDIENKEWLFTTPVALRGKRVLRTRTCVPPGWTLKFSMSITDSILTPKSMEDLVARSGYAAGIGDWRPSAPKPGKFGQFQLTSFRHY
jgi:hypothetical protein